jgi:hypothetical protein
VPTTLRRRLPSGTERGTPGVDPTSSGTPDDAVLLLVTAEEQPTT